MPPALRPGVAARDEYRCAYCQTSEETEHWTEHFTWSENGTRIQGKTPTGRATVLALKMNNPTVVFARRRWVSAGWHPPE